MRKGPSREEKFIIDYAVMKEHMKAILNVKVSTERRGNSKSILGYLQFLKWLEKYTEFLEHFETEKGSCSGNVT